MIPLSGWVLVVSAALTSPALWASLVEQSMSLEVALTRYLLATGVCWVALSIAADVVWPQTPARPEGTRREGEGSPGKNEPESH